MSLNLRKVRYEFKNLTVLHISHDILNNANKL